LDYIAAESPTLGLEGPLGRSRLLEALAYISTELHKSFKPFFVNSMWPEKAEASFHITKRMQYLADRMKGDYLLGDHPTVADFYLLVTLRWAAKFDVEVPVKLAELRARLELRPAVQDALRTEALI
jgi:glutathione S-transferase